MAAEIERKFLLDAPPDWLERHSGTRIEQGYLALGEEDEVRLRRAGDAFTLTVKRGRGEVREEAEIALDRDRFEALWPRTESRRVAKARHVVPLEDGLAADVDVYEGELEGLVVAEVEFDSPPRSKAFDPPAWFGAEVTGDDRYANRSLATEGCPKQKPQRSFRLKRKESIPDGVRRIALERADDALEELAAARREAERAEAIHEARKDLKKLRALLRLVRGELEEDGFKAENRRYRDAGRLLAESRDAEVKLETLEALREHGGGGPPPRAWRRWAEELERERDEAAGEGGDVAARIARAVAEIEAGREEIPRWPLRDDSWKAIGPGLGSSYRAARKGMKRTRSKPRAEHVHEWRKRVKDLWYQLRIVRSSWPAPIGELADQVHELADLLGDHHDLSVLAEDLEARDGLVERQALAALLEQRQSELLKAAFGIGCLLFAEKPKAFDARFAAYWKARS